MTDSLAKPARWMRVCTIIAVIYGVLVALAVWVSIPTQRQIESDAASNAIWALQQYEDKYSNMPLRDIRRRLYRGLSDQQVTARVRDFASSEERRVSGNAGSPITSPEQLTLGLLGGDTVRPKIAVLMEEADKIYATRMASLQSDQRRVVAWGVAAWLIPVVLLYILAPRLLHRRRTLQRL